MKKATPGKQGLKIVGHRGVRGLAPEHTVIAINKALEAKVDEIEVDVRITKDGVLILHHDPTCQDASGNKLVVREASFDELLRHKPDFSVEAYMQKEPFRQGEDAARQRALLLAAGLPA